jgi:hypothetical protein
MQVPLSVANSEMHSVVEPHLIDPAPGKSFDAAPVLTLPVLYTKPTFLKQA